MLLAAILWVACAAVIVTAAVRSARHPQAVRPGKRRTITVLLAA